MPLNSIPVSSTQSMSSSSHRCLSALSCCCPCILLGNITSKLRREKPYHYMNFAPDSCKIGPDGLKTCAFTCCLAVSGGYPVCPVSCCLSCYLLRQRWKIKLFYPEYENFKLPQTVCAWSNLCCFWQKNLLEQYEFINGLLDDGLLTYKWDFDLYRDQLGTKPILETHTILVFGPSTTPKETFLNKFLYFSGKDYKIDFTVSLPENLNGPAVQSDSLLDPNNELRSGNNSPLVDGTANISKNLEESPLLRSISRPGHNITPLIIDSTSQLPLQSSIKTPNSGINGNESATLIPFTTPNKRGVTFSFPEATPSQVTPIFFPSVPSTPAAHSHYGDIVIHTNEQSKSVQTSSDVTNPVKTGLRTVSLPSGEKVFLEVWDIPQHRFSRQPVLSFLSTASFSYYIFDPWDFDSISLMKNVFQANARITPQPRIIIILKYVPPEIGEDGAQISWADVINPKESREAEIVSWAERQREPWHLVSLNNNQDFHALQSQIIRILSSLSSQ